MRRAGFSWSRGWAVTAVVALLASACGVPPDRGTDPAPPPTGPGGVSTGMAPPVAVSEDRRGLVTSDGSRFVWIADTAWFLTQRLTRTEIEQYLDTRVGQGFTTIQMVGVASLTPGFGETQNRQGDLPFESDFGSLRVTDGDDPGDDQAYDYWDHVEFAVRAAHARGLTVAFLPAWSRAHAGTTLKPEHAREYGSFIAERLAGVPVIWVLGGDDPQPHPDLWREMTAGIREVDPDGLLSYHPAGWHTSIGRVENPSFHMVQTSHCDGTKNGYARLVEETLAAKPGAPVIDAEPLYEDHPWCWDTAQGYSTEPQVRAHLWWSVFAGGFGATYGHHSVWQFHDTDGRAAINAPRPTWREALDAPVAGQIRHLRTFLSALPSPAPRPDPTLLAGQAGDGWERALALRSDDGRFGAVYTPNARPLSIQAGRLAGSSFEVRWFDPRTGTTTPGETRDRSRLTDLRPPGETGDWVLILRAR